MIQGVRNVLTKTFILTSCNTIHITHKVKCTHSTYMRSEERGKVIAETAERLGDLLDRPVFHRTTRRTWRRIAAH